MDRIISLLAALVGLVALGAAIVIHTNVDAERQQMATDMAQIKLSIGLTPQPAPVAPPTPVAAPAKPADDGTANALLALQNRIAVLEQTTRDQADQLAKAQTAKVAASSSPEASSSSEVVVATAPDAAASSSSAMPSQGAMPTALSSDGPTTDCIPLGTRFMASSSDSFPICKTKIVIKVASVDDGSVTINGPGQVAAGGFAALAAKGCQVMVFSADTSGYAEMRVTCQ